jgi:hypothetical protein
VLIADRDKVVITHTVADIPIISSAIAGKEKNEKKRIYFLNYNK